jgi:hypothetical protein
MWIANGSLLSTGFFLLGTVFFLIAAARPFRANAAIGLSVITGLTIHNPWFWVAFLASLVIGCDCRFLP